MSDQFINPNFHVILIHLPLGLLVVGTLIELFAFLWRRSALRAAGRWMILLGALSLAPTAAAGLYAMWDVSRANDADVPWVDVRSASPVQGRTWELMKEHALYNTSGSISLLLLVVIWLAGSDRFRARLHLVFMILLLGGVGTILRGAWHGGEMVYRHGVGAMHEPQAAQETPTKHGVEYYLPPLQVHVILAGAAIAAALAAIGLSMRAGKQATATIESTAELSDITYALNRDARPRNPLVGSAQMNTLDDAALRVDVRRTPVARFWLLAALIAIAAALAGWWTLASESETWVVRDLWQTVVQNAQSQEYRRLAHVATGGGIVVLMLLAALIARIAAGRRIVLSLFVLVLLAAVTVQVWFGSLLLLDTSSGPLNRFKGSEMNRATPSTTIPATRPAQVPRPNGATAP